MFHIEFDAAANLLRISVKGFWTVEDVATFAKAIGTAANEARAINDGFDVMVESFEFPVQANDVADLLAEVMRGGAALSGGHFAVVVGSQLNKLQAERTLVHPRLRVFLSIGEAQRWLGKMRSAAA